MNELFTPQELRLLNMIVATFIDESAWETPYEPEMYSIIKKLGITQEDVTQRDLTPPYEKKKN